MEKAVVVVLSIRKKKKRTWRIEKDAERDDFDPSFDRVEKGITDTWKSVFRRALFILIIRYPIPPLPPPPPKKKKKEKYFQKHSREVVGNQHSKQNLNLRICTFVLFALFPTLCFAGCFFPLSGFDSST